MRHHRALRVWAIGFLAPLLTLLPTAGRLSAQDVPDPRFQSESLKKLSCKVRRFGKASGSFVMLRIEVRNRSSHWAEPMVFRVMARAKDKKAPPLDVTVFRMPQPHLRRFGRGVAPGGKQTYIVQFPQWKPPKQFRAEVHKAVFYAGKPLPKPDIVIGKLQPDHYRSDARRYPMTRCTVKNNTGRPIDAWFLADFTEPIDGRTLLRLHLGAGEKKTWEIREQATGMQGRQGSVMGAKVTRLQLVDWTTLLEVDPKAGLDLFKGAYNAWARWPDQRRTLEGRFRWRRSNTVDKKVKHNEASGSFTLDTAGKISLQADAGTTTNDRSAASLDMDKMFRDVLRPDLAFVLKHNKVRQLDEEWVELAGSGLSRMTNLPESDPWRLQFRVRSGRFVASRSSLDNPVETWQLQDEADGYLVAERTTARHLLTRHRWSYLRVGEQMVPAVLQARIETRATGNLEQRQLVLTGLRWTGAAGGGGPAQKLPPATGTGVEALRAIWNRPYHYRVGEAAKPSNKPSNKPANKPASKPANKVTLHARFELKNPGTDMVWHGLRRVSGKLTLHGFRGFLMGRGWQRAEVQLDQKLTEGDRAGVAAAVRGRLTMWASRDITGRQDFDQVFAGARIRKSKTGSRFEIAGGRYSAVGVGAGLPSWVEYRLGGRRTFRYQQVGEAWISVETRLGKERLTARWREVQGWLLPVDIRLQRALGEDWGPEHLKLSGIKIDG